MLRTSSASLFSTYCSYSSGQRDQQATRPSVAARVVRLNRPGGNSFIKGVGCGSTAGMRRASAHYLQALQLARQEQYNDARDAFQTATAMNPAEVQAWVSWAQMEKRTESLTNEAGSRKYQRCRAVLQQALVLNPDNARICQAWGLLELQAGNTWAALALLERSVRADPKCSPVLRWRAVQAARLVVSQRRQHVSRSKLNAKLSTII